MTAESKSARVRTLLTTTGYSPREIADIVGCAYGLVTYQRRRLRMASQREAVERRVSFLEQAVRELRAEVRTLRRSRPGPVGLKSRRKTAA